jgi:hypothetical protein
VTYFFANGGNLVTLDHDGGLVRDTLIVVNDDISVLLYPQILVDGHGRLGRFLGLCADDNTASRAFATYAAVTMAPDRDVARHAA